MGQHYKGHHECALLQVITDPDITSDAAGRYRSNNQSTSCGQEFPLSEHPQTDALATVLGNVTDPCGLERDARQSPRRPPHTLQAQFAYEKGEKRELYMRLESWLADFR